MKVAMYYGQQDVRVGKLAIPEIAQDEILVEMRACGICGSDLMDWYLKSRAPLVLGHEPSGVIAEKGDGVEGFEIGDRVFVHHHVACLKCHYCRSGDYTLCAQFHETNIIPGGFAEYFRVPALNLSTDTLKIPDGLSFEEATLIEPLGCCLRALGKCSLQKGDIVAIVGAGTTGLLHAALSKHFGAAKIIVSDLFEYRLNFAKRFGADVVVNPKDESFAETVSSETNGLGADLVVVAASALEAYKAGLSVCRKGGRLCVFAPTEPRQCLNLSPGELFFSEVKIIPSYSTSHVETREALQLLCSGIIDAGPLVTHRFPLEQAAQAFKTARDNKECLKVVVVNESSQSSI